LRCACDAAIAMRWMTITESQGHRSAVAIENASATGMRVRRDNFASHAQRRRVAVVKSKLHLFDLLWICCTTSCTTNPQQIHSKSTTNRKGLQQIHNKSTTNRKPTTNPQHLDMSRCCGFVVGSTTNPQQIERVEYSFRLAVDLL
jgi:hypothetical protein